jgi:hypothetical protein
MRRQALDAVVGCRWARRKSGLVDPQRTLKRLVPRHAAAWSNEPKSLLFAAPCLLFAYSLVVHFLLCRGRVGGLIFRGLDLAGLQLPGQNELGLKLLVVVLPGAFEVLWRFLIRLSCSDQLSSFDEKERTDVM